MNNCISNRKDVRRFVIWNFSVELKSNPFWAYAKLFIYLQRDVIIKFGYKKDHRTGLKCYLILFFDSPRELWKDAKFQTRYSQIVKLYQRLLILSYFGNFICLLTRRIAIIFYLEKFM